MYIKTLLRLNNNLDGDLPLVIINTATKNQTQWDFEPALQIRKHTINITPTIGATQHIIKQAKKLIQKLTNVCCLKICGTDHPIFILYIYN